MMNEAPFKSFTRKEALALYESRKDRPHSNLQELFNRIQYHYKNMDGSYTLPNTLEGDLLKFVIAEMEGNKQLTNTGQNQVNRR